MKRAKITGINGSIEIDNKYIYLIIGTKHTIPSKSKVILFEEVEDVIYKKPTRDKYGYLTIYLFTENYSTGTNEKYTLILDKVNDKYLEEVNRIYNFLNELKYANRDIEIEEHDDLDIVPEEEKEREPAKQEPKKEAKTDNQDLTQGIKITNLNIQNVDVNGNIKQEGIELPQEETKETRTFQVPFVPTDKPKETTRTIIGEVTASELPTTPIEEKEKQEKEFEEINRLEKRLKELEKDLVRLDYKITILNKYVDETKEKEELDRLIKEVKRIIEELEKIDKEFAKNQKKLKQNESIRLSHGFLLIQALSDNAEGLDKEDLYDFVNKYNETLKSVEDVEKKTEKLSEDTNKKKEEIGLADEVFEKDLMSLRRVKNTREFIEKYTQEAIEDVNKIRRQIEITTDQRTRYRYIRRGISRQTRNLSRMALLTGMIPGFSSKMAALALSARAGIGAISDMFTLDAVEEHYTEVTRTETLIGVDNVDTVTARGLIDESKRELDKIIEDCERKYGDFPQFAELKKELTDVKDEIEKEDQRLKEAEYQLQKYSEEQRVKVLRYTQN